MILEILDDHSSGCKETELVTDLVVRCKEGDMEFSLDLVEEALKTDEIGILTYYHPLTDKIHREKRFIVRKHGTPRYA